MRRRELVALLTFALLLAVGGVVWLFGPLGMLAAGLALGVLALTVIDIKEDRRE